MTLARGTRTRRRAPLAVLVLLGAASATACSPVKRPDGGTGLLTVGSAAPDFEGKDAAGHPVRLSEQRGHPVVVYFYPKDGTPGCTTEACAFRDAWKRYDEKGVAVFGVSRDSESSHDAFRAKHTLPFPLVADEDGSVDRAYGVPSLLGMSKRVTFL